MLPRRHFLAAATGLGASLIVAGCHRGGAGAASSDDMTIGQQGARAHLIEYASSTCPICKAFHDTVWAELKANYIDTGKLLFTLREFPAHEPALAVAGFQLARCGGVNAEDYFKRIDTLFAEQDTILGAGSLSAARDRLIEVGRGFGLSPEQANACIQDPAGAQRVTRNVEGARQYNITGTPTFVLNDRVLTDPSVMTYTGLSHAIDAALSG